MGIVVSPVMWLAYYDPLLQVISPLCGNIVQLENGAALPKVATILPPAPLSKERLVQRQQDYPSNISWSKYNKSRFAFDEGPTVTPPNDPKTRYRYLSDELAHRKLLLVGVVTAKKYIDSRAVAINQTWGRELPDLYYFSSHSDNSSIDLPVITLPGVNDSVYPPQRKVYRMLQYMHDHFIDEYDFFMRSDDDVYVKTDLLLELLSTINPAQEIYMGSPGFGRPDDRSRIKLTEEEHYCMGGPGVIFSRSALRRLAPHLNTCLEVSANYTTELVSQATETNY